MMTTNYQKYVNDGLNQSVGSKIWKPHLHTLWRSGQFSDEDDITGVKLIDKDFHQFNEKTYEMNSIWISAKGIIHLMLGWICMQYQLVKIQWHLNYTSPLHLLIIH